MRKNLSIISLISTTVLFVLIICGILIYRHKPSPQIPQSVYDQEAYPAVQTEIPAEDIGKININLASESELKQLSGIGTALASRIIEYRETNGPFNSIEEILKISGIGDAKFNAIKDYITVGG